MVVLDRCASWQLTDVLTVIGVVVLCGVCLAAGVAGVVAADAGDEVGLTTDRILSTQYETDVSGDIVPDTGTVIGTVTAEDGEPIPDADIEVVEQIDDGNPDPVEGGFTANLTTDENGEFEVEVRSGVYRITAGALGYANGLNQNVEVGVGETVEDVDFQLSPVPVLSGSVTDAETGDPIEGAEIGSRRHTSALYTATTNATGEYSINLPDDASSSVEFVADGYFSEFVEVDEADLDDLPDIHVALDPVPEETGFVVGQVTNQVGDPVQSAFVTAVDSPMPGVLTNQTGWYELEVETGSHTIEVLWEGPEFPRIVEGVEVTEGDTTRVDVGAVDSGDPELAVHEAVGLPEEVETGENVTIDTAIENVGEGDGTLLVPLEVNGDVVEAVAYELNASESATVSFDHSFDSRGEYEVFVGDFRVGNVTVRKSADVTIFGASVNRSELVVGEPAVITANLYNRGDVEGNLTIDLRVEGEHVVNQTVENDTVTVDPGISRDAVEFVWTPTEGELGGAETDNVTLKLNDRTVETLPLELRITDVQVIAAATDADQVVHNETFHVTGSIYQAGTIEGPQEIALNATHEDTGETVPLNTTEVSLPPGWYHLGALNLSGTFSERTTAGTYELTLGDREAGTIEVAKSYSDIKVIAGSANATEVVQGQTFHATGSIYQNGTIAGPERIALNATPREPEGTDPITLAWSDEVSLPPGWYHLGALNLSTTIDDDFTPGTYDLHLGDREIGSLEVIAAKSDIRVIAGSANATEVVQGQSFHATGSIYQNGTIAGPETIALNATPREPEGADPITLAWSDEVSLPPGWYHLGALNLSATVDDDFTPGTYDLHLGDREIGTLEVIAAKSDIRVIAGSANATEIVQGQSFYATGSIYQNGTIDGPQTIALNATLTGSDDPITLAWSDEVSLPPGWYHLGALNVSVTVDDDFTPGTYDLHLGDREIGTLEVIAAKSDIQVIAGSANATEVVQNETFYATGSIYQNGTIAGPETIALNATPREPEGADPITLAWSDEVSLPPGWYHLGALNLSATFDDDFTPGTYDLHLGDREIGSLEVITAESDIQVISASPSEMNVTRSETFYVTGGIYQNGTIDGPQEIPLNATPYGTNDPITLNTTEATLKPGWYHLGGLNVSATFDDGMAVGRYNLTLGDYHVGTIGVEESPSDVQVIAASLSEIAVVEGEELYVTGSVYQNGTANGDDWSENVSLIGTPENGDGEPEVLGSDEVHVQPGWYALNAINISFSIPEPGTYTLTLGEHYAGTVEVLPAESDVRVIAGSANATEVVQGQSFHATGSIYQNGTIDGPQTIALNATLNGSDDPITLAWSDEVSLPPGWYHLGALNLSATVDDDFTPGTYDLHLGDREIGTLEVQAAKSDVQVIAGSANATEVVQGQSFYATGSIYQNGTIDGPEKIPLNATPREPEGADPVTLARSDEVSLPPGWYHLGGLNLSATVDGDFTPGTYDLHLGDREIGTLEVIAAESDIRVIAGSPNATEVVQGQSFYATGSIYQNGTIDGPQTIALNATLTGSDDPITLAWSDEVSLPPGWYHLGGLNLSATIGDDFTPGTYKLDLGDREIGTLEVLAAESDIQVIAGSADAEEVAYGEAFHVTGSIYQNGTIDGPQSIPLNATQVDTGETETLGWSDEVSLPPSWYHLGALNLSATFGPDAGGTYDLTLGEYYAGTITVSEPTVAVTAVDVRGAGTGVDPDLEYASDDVTVDVTVQSDLPIEDVHVFVESRETTFIEDVEATHVDDEVWSAEIPVEDLPDDGAYDVSALAIDEFDTPGDLKANRTLVIDTEAPSLSVSVEDISGVDATIVVESSEPLDGVPDVDATFEDDPGVDIDVTMDQASMGGTTYTGTIEFDESGNYTVTATGTDLAGNTGEDSTSAVIYTGISIADQAITIDATGTTIDFDVADHAVTSDELFLAFSESAVNANVDGGDVGVGFLTAELDDVLHDYMAGDEVAGATISMAIDETALPGDAVAEDVELQYFDEANDAWDPVTGSEVNRVGGDPFVTASVTHFSTYGAVLPDTTPPEITVVESPADGAVFDAETDSVDFEVTFEDPYSGIDASSVTIEVNGVDRSEDFAYTSSWLNDTLDVEDGTAYEVTLSVSDEAGNEATHAVSFEVASSSPESPESSDGGSGSSGDDGDSGSSGSSGSSDSSGSSSESSTPGADDDTSAEDDESPDSDADFSVPDDTPGTGDGDSTTDETGHDDGGDTPSESDNEPDVDEEDSVPGFGVIIAVFAALLVAVRLTRPR